MAQTVMVVSGKGGVGKSTLAVLLGQNLSELGRRTVLIEMDAGLRSMDILLGAGGETVYDISDVLQQRCEPSKAVYRVPSSKNLAFIPAPMNPLAQADAAFLKKLVKSLSLYYDYILIEAPAGFTGTFEVIAASCDLALIVLTPDPICVRDARVVSDRLDGLGLYNQKLLVNKIKTKNGRLEFLPDIDAIIDSVAKPLLGLVPHDESAALLMKGRLLPPKCGLMRACAAIAKRLTGAFVELEVM